MREKIDRRPISSRKQEHAAMLETALARSGVREAMRVYGSRWGKDRGLDAYRSAAKPTRRITTTDRSTPR